MEYLSGIDGLPEPSMPRRCAELSMNSGTAELADYLGIFTSADAMLNTHLSVK